MIRVPRWIRLLNRARELIREERSAPVDVALAQRLTMWRHGFISRQFHFYDFARYGYAPYLTDVEHFMRVPDVNGSAREILNDKLLFTAAMSRWPGSVPALFGLVQRGRLRADRTRPELAGIADVAALARRTGAVVLKPVRGHHGLEVAVLAAESGGTLRLNDVPIDEAAMRAFVAWLDGYMVTAFVRQADYARRINPHATNTLRMLTLRDPATGRAFLGPCVHRFGTRRSGPVDNWDRGGLCAEIDLESGRLGSAVASPLCGERLEVERHPDSGQPISGVVVPGWERAKATVLAWADGLAGISLCGWDVVLDEAGRLRALEGNSRHGFQLNQVHRPLLLDDRVAATLRYHGVLRRPVRDAA